MGERFTKFKNIGKSAIQGNLLLYVGFDRYLDRIVYLFVCALLFIWFNIQIDITMHRKEENRIAIENLKSIHTDTTCRLTALNSVCEVEQMLKEMGSKVQIPQRQAETIK